MSSLPTGPRPTEHITKPQALNLLDAWHFAHQQGRCPNLSVNVVLAGSSFYDEGPATYASTKRSRDAALRVLRDVDQRHGGSRTDYIYALENPPQGGRGLHMHILYHAARSYEIESYVEDLSTLFHHRFKWAPRPERFDPLEIKCLKSLERSLGGVGYMCKGIHPKLIEDISLPDFRRDEPQGRIYGQRCSPSRTLQPSARAAAGFVPLADLTHLSYSNVWELVEKRELQVRRLRQRRLVEAVEARLKRQLKPT